VNESLISKTQKEGDQMQAIREAARKKATVLRENTGRKGAILKKGVDLKSGTWEKAKAKRAHAKQYQQKKVQSSEERGDRKRKK